MSTKRIIQDNPGPVPSRDTHTFKGFQDAKDLSFVSSSNTTFPVLKVIKIFERYVQQITNSPVDMRVGIHTGAVLAGVLGQRQWQFDVYSKDVELANKMESSGMAGRVHISEVTYSFLGNHFEVEPAHGERREEALRQAGIKTYFIVKVLIPFQSSNHVKNGKPNVTFEDEKKQVSTNGNPDVGDNEEVQLDTPSDLKDDDEESVKSPLEENKIDEVEALIKGLENEILKKNEHEELKGNTTLCLRFNDKELEHQYTERTEICNIMYIVHPFVLPICMYIMLYFQSIRDTNKLIFVTMFVVFVSTIGYGVYIWIRVKPYNTLKRICTLINIFSMVVGMIVQVYWDECKESCEQWSYYWHCCVCIILSALFISPLTVAPHTVLLLALPAVLSLPYILYPRQGEHRAVYYINETDTNRPFVHQTLLIIDSLHYYRHALMLFFISIALAIYIRYIDACSRARFVRCVRVRRARAQADEMRRRNEKLVLNILPPHVAAHFMRGARRHHSDLYSQSLAEVGVLFASMPNFTEFYSEETVNNQGLECLRFLNEVISDFDALLEKPQFHDIIKIKTIGSTYMAASGINPRDVKPDDTITVRWQHLDCLVQFAIELKDALQGINEQSFNHFVLKMGINHGPITAGVIGARKPHYDIWGNTVNVASRMESTGKAGCIQVTTETSEILKHFGYYFEQRGLVAVKGKGQLMTYYLLGKHTQADKTEIKHNESEASKHVTGDTNVISGTSTAKVKFKQDSTDVDETSETAPLNDEKTISGSGGNGRRKELSLNGDVKSRLLSDDGCEGDHDN